MASILALQVFSPLPPPVARPKVACYVSQKFLQSLLVLPVFFSESEDFMPLDIYTPLGCFSSTCPRFRIGNAYARLVNPSNYSVSPETSFIDYDFPYLVAGKFNIHNPAIDPFRVLSSNEERESALFFDIAADLGFSLLNIPGTYTRFPFSSSHQPSAIDLSFANPYLFPAFNHWDATSLLSTGSDHIPTLISLQPRTFDSY